MEREFVLRILRGVSGEQYWQDFAFELKPSMNIISCLMEIQKEPLTALGERVTPVVWESNCLEEVCGACSMLINGYPRQACTTLIHEVLEKTKSSIITVAPLSKFPLVRDLMVDRAIMFETLKQVHAWIDVDSSFAPNDTSKIPPEQQEIRYALSTCMTCGCCTESCPQMRKLGSFFVGPAAIAQVKLFNIHPSGVLQKKDRLHALMGKGGISECGNAQNCVRVCPKHIPLTDAIASIGRDVSLQFLKDLFSLPERE